MLRRFDELLPTRLKTAFVIDEVAYIEIAVLLVTLAIIRTLIGK